jgi:hypothetical protein
MKEKAVVSRLSTIAPDLVTSLERQQPDGLRRVAKGLAVLAVQRTRLSDPRFALEADALAAALEAAYEAQAAVKDLEAVRSVAANTLRD